MGRTARRFAKDETGAALGLAIVMIVLISVMGAGLLTFVMRDLESVVEVNKGQRALDIADAGVEASRTKLLAEAHPSSYDADSLSTPTYYSDDCNTDGGWNALPIPRDGAVAGGGFWNPDFGVQRDFADGAFYVQMRYLSPDSSDQRCKSPLSEKTTADGPATAAPRPKTYPIPRIDAGFYRVISTACYPGEIDDNGNCRDPRAAKRRIDAIFRTQELGAPLAIYTQNQAADSVVLNGDACVQDVNVFTMGGVQVNGDGGCPDNTATADSSAPNHLYDSGNNTLDGKTVTRFRGVYGGPFDYGDWVKSEFDNFAHLDGTATYETTTPTPYYFNANNRFNTKARTVVSPGIGAVGTISRKVQGRDYDQTGTDGSANNTNANDPGFVGDPGPSQSANEITFPFDEGSVEGQNDEDRMGLLRSEALRQEEYRYADDIENDIEVGGGTVDFTSSGFGAAYRWPQYPRFRESSPIRPQTSNFTTVVYVRFTDGSPSDNKVVWNVDHGGGCGGAPEKGVLVVENGSVEIEGNKTPFQGMVILREALRDGMPQTNPADPTPDVANYAQETGACTGGGVDATGRVSLAGVTTNINPRSSANLGHATSNFSPKEVDFPGVVGFHSVELWSWREAYE